MKRQIMISVVLDLTLAAAASQAPAQGFGGSFDTPPGQAPAQSPAQSPVQSPTQPAPQPSAPSGGGFGGSFDTGGGSTGIGGGSFDPGGTQPAPPPVVGGDDFNGGSFDSVQPGPENPPPQPPVNQGPDLPDQQEQPTNTITIDPQILAFETRDFGVPPTPQLHNGQLHGATPSAIPGGTVVTTEALANALNSGMQLILIDVLGGQYTIPTAYSATGLAQPGTFQDRTQQQAAQWLQQITGGNTSVPIVVFCSDPQCWLSYNAALRTINAGFQQVYWYRGGLQAWEMAGLPMQPASF